MLFILVLNTTTLIPRSLTYSRRRKFTTSILSLWRACTARSNELIERDFFFSICLAASQIDITIYIILLDSEIRL